MSAEIQLPKVRLSEPDEWLEFRDRDRIFYANPVIALYAMDGISRATMDSNELAKINLHKGNILLYEKGLRTSTDREYNIIVNESPKIQHIKTSVSGYPWEEYEVTVKKGPSIAKEMRDYRVWTGFLKKVEKTKNGFTALYIPNPEVRETDGGDEGFEVVGSEKRIKLPSAGWVDVREMLENETGLPEKPCESGLSVRPAFFRIEEGEGKYILRGCRYSEKYENAHFDINARWKLQHLIADRVGLMAVSDERPKMVA